MDTILVLDTSGSMAGAKMRELKASITAFLNLIEELNFGERIAIISFGNEVRVLSTLTRDYNKLKTLVSQLPSTGGTPMAQALKFAVEQLQYTQLYKIGPISLMPRVILFTDGEPNSQPEVLAIAKSMGSAGLPMVCIGVIGCDKNLMQNLAQLSGGMFLMAEDMAVLQLFFIRQVLLISYIREAKEQLENLYNRELLRNYLQSKTNQPVSDEELDGFIYFLKHLIRTDVAEEEQHRCKCCCCACTCRNLMTSFLFLVCLSAFGWAGYALHIALTTGYPGVDQNVVTFAVASLIIALIYTCGCSVHLIYLRTIDDESVLWLVEVLTVIFLVVPETLLFAAIYRSDGTFVLPSAITLVTLMGVCCFCGCCVRCLSRQ